MLFEMLFQFLEPNQIVNAVLVATVSIVLRHVFAVFLSAFLSFLVNLAVIIALFLIFLAALLTLAALPPVP